jgi:hypothetical protein
MKTWKSFTKGDLLGVHLAVNIFGLREGDEPSNLRVLSP